MKTIWIIIVFLFIFTTSCVWPPATKNLVIFKNDPCIIPYLRYEYKTCDKMDVLVDYKPVTVPEEFVTDLASIPRPLWSVFSPRFSNFIAPSILHDYMYKCPHFYTRKEADDIFYSALLANGVTRVTSTKFYMGVRLFGWMAYKRNCDEY